MTRHTPNHEPDDLRQPRRTDATPHAEADVLDALLNEIAQEPGSASTRSASRPNDRTPPTADEPLAASARAFHRHYAAAEARDRGAGGLDPTLWEQIMASSAPPNARVTSGNPWLAGNPAATDSRPAASARRWLPTRTWTGLANATLALLIIAAAFATWQVYDRVNTPSGSDNLPTSTVPGLAMQPSTPEDVAPVATPTPAYTCDFTHDIPIFQFVDESPVDGTAVLLTTSGDLVLTCPEEPEPITLATGLDQVGPGGWPGTVDGYSGWPDDGDYRAVTINIMTGQSMETGFSEQMQTTGFNELVQTPWKVTPSVADPSRWAITDLRTMESQSLNTIGDPPGLSGGTVVPPGSPLIVATAGDTIVMGIMTNNDIDGEGALFDVEGLPGTLLVLNGSFDNAHWIDIPGDLSMTRGMRLSPDGQFLALKSNDGEASFDGTITYTIIRTSDGKDLGRSEGVKYFESEMTWIQDGHAIAYTNNQSLMTLAAEEDAQPATMLEASDDLRNLRTTYDPNVVTVRAIQPEEVATETPDAVRSVMYAVNTVSGESIEFEGWDVRDSYGWELPPTHYLVLSDDRIQDTGPVTYRVVDVLTGEEVGTIDDVPVSEGEGLSGMGRHTLAISDDGATEVIGFGSAYLYLVRSTFDGAEVRQLTSPPGLPESVNGPTDLFVSPSGSFVTLTVDGDESRTRWLLPLDGATDEWIEVPNTVPGSDPGYIYFVPGTGD